MKFVSLCLPFYDVFRMAGWAYGTENSDPAAVYFIKCLIKDISMMMWAPLRQKRHTALSSGSFRL